MERWCKEINNLRMIVLMPTLSVASKSENEVCRSSVLYDRNDYVCYSTVKAKATGCPEEDLELSNHLTSRPLFFRGD